GICPLPPSRLGEPVPSRAPRRQILYQQTPWRSFLCSARRHRPARVTNPKKFYSHLHIRTSSCAGQCQRTYFRGILKKGMSMYVWASQLIGRRSEGTRPLAGGWLIPADDGVAAASDRGFTLGDGLFETVLIRGGDA